MLEPLGHHARGCHGGEVEVAPDLIVAAFAAPALGRIEQQPRGLRVLRAIEVAEAAPVPPMAAVREIVDVRRESPDRPPVPVRGEEGERAEFPEQRVLPAVQESLQVLIEHRYERRFPAVDLLRRVEERAEIALP